MTFKGIISNQKKNDLAKQIAIDAGIPFSRCWTDMFLPVMKDLDLSSARIPIDKLYTPPPSDDTAIESNLTLYIFPDIYSPADTYIPALQAILDNNKYISTIISDMNSKLDPVNQFPTNKAFSYDVLCKELSKNPGTPNISQLVVNNTLVAFNDSINATISIINMDGFIYFAVIEAAKQISVSQNLLRFGNYSEGGQVSRFPIFEYRRVVADSNDLFQVYNLSNTTEYTVYYYGTNDDPTGFALYTPVYSKSITTLDKMNETDFEDSDYDEEEDFGSHFHFSLCSALFSLLFLMLN